MQYVEKKSKKKLVSLQGHSILRFSFMKLTASLGFEAKNRSVSAIFVCPLKPKREGTVLRKATVGNRLTFSHTNLTVSTTIYPEKKWG